MSKDLEKIEIVDLDDSAELGLTQESYSSTVTEHLTSKLYALKLMHSSEREVGAFSEELKFGDYVVAQTRYGMDLVKTLGEVTAKEGMGNIILIDRIAAKADLEKFKKNKLLADEAFAVCKSKIVSHGLEMKLIAAHCLLDEAKILFMFTAERRVDFRELVKDLVSFFHVRIELRQIGVRDETRALGGLAVCGRDYCCHGVTDHLKPVSIKMVKDQNMSLNSMKISGSCGRLLCCLAYEHEYYGEQRKVLPPENTRVKAGGEIWRVTDVNIISQKIALQHEDGRYLSLPAGNFEQDKDTGKWQAEAKKRCPTCPGGQNCRCASQ